jgi:hypothetical protein
MSVSGLITSALLKKTDVRESVAKGLVERAISILDQNAVSRGNLVGANAIFLEIRESDSDATDGEDLSRQHTLLEKMGWRLIDFNYVAPPLARGGQPRPRLSQSIFLTPRIPRVPYEQQGYEFHYMPKPLMKQFMQYASSYGCLFRPPFVLASLVPTTKILAGTCGACAAPESTTTTSSGRTTGK